MQHGEMRPDVAMQPGVRLVGRRAARLPCETPPSRGKRATLRRSGPQCIQTATATEAEAVKPKPGGCKCRFVVLGCYCCRASSGNKLSGVALLGGAWAWAHQGAPFRGRARRRPPCHLDRAPTEQARSACSVGEGLVHGRSYSANLRHNPRQTVSSVIEPVVHPLAAGDHVELEEECDGLVMSSADVPKGSDMASTNGIAKPADYSTAVILAEIGTDDVPTAQATAAPKTQGEQGTQPVHVSLCRLCPLVCPGAGQEFPQRSAVPLARERMHVAALLEPRELPCPGGLSSHRDARQCMCSQAAHPPRKHKHGAGALTAAL